MRAARTIPHSEDRHIYWARFAVYYYDESGKQLEFEIDGYESKVLRSQVGGSFKANETATREDNDTHLCIRDP